MASITSFFLGCNSCFYLRSFWWLLAWTSIGTMAFIAQATLRCHLSFFSLWHSFVYFVFSQQNRGPHVGRGPLPQLDVQCHSSKTEKGFRLSPKICLWVISPFIHTLTSKSEFPKGPLWCEKRHYNFRAMMLLYYQLSSSSPWWLMKQPRAFLLVLWSCFSSGYY